MRLSSMGSRCGGQISSRRTSNCLDFEMATPAGLSLNEKVGLTESFFIKRFLRFPICVPNSSANCKGVKPAWMFTMQFLSGIGKSSKKRQYVLSVLDENVSLFKSLGTSYMTSSGPKHSSQMYLNTGVYSAPHSLHFRNRIEPMYIQLSMIV